MRKRLALLLLCIFMSNYVLASDPFQGYAEYDNEYVRNEEELFTDKTDTNLEKFANFEGKIISVNSYYEIYE